MSAFLAFLGAVLPGISQLRDVVDRWKRRQRVLPLANEVTLGLWVVVSEWTICSLAVMSLPGEQGRQLVLSQLRADCEPILLKVAIDTPIDESEVFPWLFASLTLTQNSRVEGILHKSTLKQYNKQPTREWHFAGARTSCLNTSEV